MIGLRERPLLRERGYQPPPIDRLPETAAETPFGLPRFGRSGGARRSIEQIALPTIAPGQLWLVEVSPVAAELQPFELDAFNSANVVIYDRELTQFVSESLPLGSYAEPAAAYRPFDKAEFERTLRLALDGWSVLRLLGGKIGASDRADRVSRIAARLCAAGIAAELPVQLVSDKAGAHDTKAVALGDLADATGTYDFSRRVAVVFGTRHNGAGEPSHRVVDNGLAG